MHAYLCTYVPTYVRVHTNAHAVYTYKYLHTCILVYTQVHTTYPIRKHACSPTDVMCNESTSKGCASCMCSWLGFFALLQLSSLDIFSNASLILCSFSSILLANPGGMRLRGLDDERQHSKLWTVQLLEHVLPSSEHGVMAQPCFHHMHNQPCTWNAAGALRSCPLPVHRTLPSPGKRKEFSLKVESSAAVF